MLETVATNASVPQSAARELANRLGLGGKLPGRRVHIAPRLGSIIRMSARSDFPVERCAEPDFGVSNCTEGPNACLREMGDIALVQRED